MYKSGNLVLVEIDIPNKRKTGQNKASKLLKKSLETLFRSIISLI